MTNPRIAVILPAAGSGRRFGDAARPKVELDLAGKPVFQWSIELFLRRPAVASVLLAVHPERRAAFEFAHGDLLELLGVTLLAGGTVERWETVAKALAHVDPTHTHVAVHDAARPLATRAMVDRVFAAAERYDAVLPAMPAANTLKRAVDVPPDRQPGDAIDAILGGAAVTAPPAKRVVETVDRSDLIEAQTPQVFRADLLRRAYGAVASGAVDTARVTDDAGLVEALGETVYAVEGESTNVKITRPDDAELAAAVLERRAAATAKADAEDRLFVDDDDD